MTTYTDIAGRVLAYAKLLDGRMPQADPGVLKAWTQVFDGQPVFLEESLQAVTEHYRQENAPRIMPGDIIGRIRRMPIGPQSSTERIDHEINKWANRPWSPALATLTGVDIPDDVRETPDAYRQWVDWHRDALHNGIRATQRELS